MPTYPAVADPLSEDERPLTEHERASIELLLVPELPGAAELQAQLDHVRVIATWSNALELRVDPGTAPPATIDPRFETASETNSEPPGLQLLLWTRDGYLSELELLSWDVADRPWTPPEEAWALPPLDVWARPVVPPPYPR